MPDYGTDRLSLQNTTGAIQNNSGDPLLSTDDFGATAFTFGPTLQQELFGGIANGNFASPTALVGTDEPIAEGNPLPYWTLVDNSSGRVALSIVADTGSASGYAMNVKLTDAQANDYAYLERIVPILATKDQAMTYVFAVYNTAGTSAGGTSSTKLQIEAQYLQADGITATGADGVAYGSIITTGTKFISANTTGVAPSDAAFLRVRVGGLEQVGFTGVAETTVYEMRVETGTARVIITDDVDPNTYSYASLVQTNGALRIGAGSSPAAITIGVDSIYVSPTVPSGTVVIGGSATFLTTANFNGGSVNIGADVNLYRLSANNLKTDDSLFVAGSAVITGNLAAGGISFTNLDVSGTANIVGTATFGTTVNFSGGSVNIGADVNIYRTGANALRTDDVFVVGTRTTPATSSIDRYGFYFSPDVGFMWGDRDVSGNTDANLFLSSGFLNSTLQMVRFFRKITSGGTALSATGHILVANNTTTAPSFGAGSDWRLKENVRDANTEITFTEKVSSLRPVLYTEKATGDELLGFIAHEVQGVIPEAVEGEKDAVDENGEPVIQNLYSAKFIVYLVGAVKELTARVAELEEKVATLESRP
jgi:hypothetical protein